MDKGAGDHQLQRQLATLPDREPLTEAEARRIGVAAQRLARYRYLLTQAGNGGAINATPGGGKLFGENIPASELQAALAFLMEREELFLASFGVTIERPE